MTKKLLFALGSLVTGNLSAQIVYEGEEAVGKDKHIVFIASDHEYRAEQTCPALARILAKHHGFKCTVLFGVDEKGFIKAGASNIKGLEALEKADGVVLFTRFLNLPADQMELLLAYVERGGPLVGLRTSSHAFKIPKDSKYAKFSYNYKGEDFPGGFGQQYLGNTWEGHYGENHKQGTRIQILPAQKDNPILRGVGDNAFCHAGGYSSVVRDGMTPLTMTQPLVSMDPTSEPDPNRKPVASTWTREYRSKSGAKARVFHSTQGCSEDILDDDYRRLLVNGIFWSVNLEGNIKADNNVSLVGPYHPTTFSMNGHVKNQKPEDMAGFDTVIGKKK